jgi:hypothetical protein
MNGEYIGGAENLEKWLDENQLTAIPDNIVNIETKSAS